MNSTAMQKVGPLDSASRAFGRFMAVEDTEWDAIRIDPKLGTEIVFQSLAVLYCSGFFCWAIFNIAVGLLGYPFLGAAIFAILMAFCLGSIDRHVRIQTRGAPEAFRGIILKARLASVSIVAVSGILMTGNSFRADIDRVIVEQKREIRAYLETAPNHAVELNAARRALDEASKAVARADALRGNIPKIKVAQAHEFAASKDECQGNESGNQIRIRGCGPKARGHETVAQRLGQELEAAQDELSQLGNVTARLKQAQIRLSEITGNIDAEVNASVQGSSRRLDALWSLVKTSPAAALTVFFWILVGMLPDIMMWIAFGRSPNDKSFACVRAIQEQSLVARLARYRAEMRSQEAYGLVPLDVRLAVVPSSMSKPDAGAANERPSDANDTSLGQERV